jgi:sugar lactone lactonase YvrE
VQLPVEIPTSAAFGGADGRTLFITTARYSLAPEALAIQPLAGSILALDVGVGGVPDARYAG